VGEALGPRGRKIAVRLKQRFAELFEIESPPHALAAQFGIGVVVGHAPRLHQREHGLDEKPAAAPLPIDDGEPGLGGPKAPVIVHAEEKR